MSNTLNEEDIKSGLSTLFGAIKAQGEAKALVSPEYAALKEKSDLIKCPEAFSAEFSTRNLETAIELLVQEQYPTLDSLGLFFYTHLIMNYKTLYWQMRSVFEMSEGSGCCADKAGFVMNEYRKHLIGEQLGDWSTDHYWTPERNKSDVWFEFLKGHAYLQCGQYQKFLVSALPIFEPQGA